jgi:gamma-glutamylcysteine synthetase
MLWGVEREALRIQQNALAETPLQIADQSHMQGKILPDFSDTQVEMVTYPRSSWEAALDDLQQLHHLFYLNHPQEYLWPHSLPPVGALQDWKDPGISLFANSQNDRSSEQLQTEVEYRQHLRQHYPLNTLLTSGIHLNIGVESSRLFPLARRIWSEMGLWAYLFGNSPSLDARLSTRLSAKGYRNTLCCTGYPLLQDLERYKADLDHLLGHWSCFRLKRASELYAPIRIKETSPKIAASAGIPSGTPYLEIRLIDLQGGPWGLEAHHLMMSEFLLEYALYRGDVGPWDAIIQETYLKRLDQVAESGHLKDAGLSIQNWLKAGEKFVAESIYHPRFSSLLQGWELVKTRILSGPGVTAPLAAAQRLAL